jgi:riboflavin kinase/FMN adenylyltransferase
VFDRVGELLAVYEAFRDGQAKPRSCCRSEPPDPIGVDGPDSVPAVLVVTDLEHCSWGDDGRHHDRCLRRRAPRASHGDRPGSPSRRELGAKSVVVTFDRTRRASCGPSRRRACSPSPRRRLELLAATGVDAVVVVPFDERRPPRRRSRSSTGCWSMPGTQVIVVGEDFHFGRHRDGNVDLLRKIGVEADFDVEPVQLVARRDGVDEPVSSTAIRRALAGGDIARANAMLGRPYEVRGTVFEGDQRGRLLGFPTANVGSPNGMCMPADGVYAGWYERPTARCTRVRSTSGRRPTFYEHADASLLEAHLLDFDVDLYGEPAEVRFAHFLRSERKFDGSMR